MGIVNAGQIDVYDQIDPTLLTLVEDVLFNRRADATERLTEFADSIKSSSKRRLKRSKNGEQNLLKKGLNTHW